MHKDQDLLYHYHNNNNNYQFSIENWIGFNYIIYVDPEGGGYFV